MLLRIVPLRRTREEVAARAARSRCRTRACRAARSRCSWSRCCARRACSSRATCRSRGRCARSARRSGSSMAAIAGGDFELRAGDLALVVAGHGRDELPALRRGLEAGAARTSASSPAARAAHGVIGELRGDGVADELLERIDTPGGAGHRRAHARRRSRSRSSRGSSRCAAQRRAAAVTDRRRPDLRHDGHGRPRHAVARARGRDGPLLLRGLPARPSRASMR